MEEVGKRNCPEGLGGGNEVIVVQISMCEVRCNSDPDQTVDSVYLGRRAEQHRGCVRP